jgi:outer membrane receptor protein involved in Fe transport
MDNSCGTPNPEWRHRLRASWRTPWDIETSLTWRHYGEVSMEGITTDRIDRDFPSYDWFDLAGSWRVRDNLTFKGGVNNIFDKDPPLSGSLSGGNGNTYPQVYDAMGRFVFMRATVDF